MAIQAMAVESVARKPLPELLGTALHRTILRWSRRCWAQSWSTTRRSTASPIFSSRGISSSRCTARSIELARQPGAAGKVATPGHAQDISAGRSRRRRPQRRVNIWRGSPPRQRPSSTPRTMAAPSTISSIRRDLIVIGEDMVNVAYDAPVDFAPADQIEDAERKLYEIAETGRYDGGFQRFAQALTTAVEMAAHAYQRDGKLSGIATEPQGSRPQDGRLAEIRPHHPRRPSGHGQDRARHQYRLQRRRVPGAARCGRRPHRDRSTAASSASSRSKCRPSSSPRVSSPSRPEFPRTGFAAARSSDADFDRIARPRVEMQNRCRSTSTRPAACPSRSSRRARGGSSASAGSTCWSSTTSSCCKVRASALRRTACRR